MASGPIIFLIRHGEKPPKAADGEDEIGLSTMGISRAQGLVGVFGKNSDYDIGYIMAQHPKKSGKRARPYLTIKPLAESLGSKVVLNDKIDRDDVQGAADAAINYQGPGNVLICWEHKQLNDIVQAMGIKDAKEYPSDRFDVIWTIKPPYEKVSAPWTSEHIQGLDDAFAGQP